MNKIFFAVCFLLVWSSTLCFSGETSSHNSYFDTATGHKYEKLNDSSFSEFSKKGELLRNVPSDLPLLLNSSNIFPIPENSYILYEKVSEGALEQQVLSIDADHPKDWKAKDILVSIE